MQAALGNPTLSAGEQLALPSSLTFQPSATRALHPYYTIQAGDTWANITQAIYGSSDPKTAAALQAALGSPVLTAGEQLTGLPPSLQVTATTHVEGYTVQAGDTWTSLTQLLYETSDPAAATKLYQRPYRYSPLTPGEVLDESSNILESMRFPQPSRRQRLTWFSLGDTWASITTALYGTADSNADRRITGRSG